jgi:hypothetical protein
LWRRSRALGGLWTLDAGGLTLDPVALLFPFDLLDDVGIQHRSSPMENHLHVFPLYDYRFTAQRSERVGAKLA